MTKTQDNVLIKKDFYLENGEFCGQVETPGNSQIKTWVALLILSHTETILMETGNFIRLEQLEK